MNALQQPRHNLHNTHQSFVRNRLFCKCIGKPTANEKVRGVVARESEARRFDALDGKHHVLADDNSDRNHNDRIVPTCRYCGGHVLLKSR
jgi:hypothetical protein